MLRSAGVLLAFLVLATPAAAGERVVLEGLPTSRVSTGPGDANREVLGPEEREKARVRIVAGGGKLFWVTREDRELTYHTGGLAHYFIDPRGGGYVKVMDYRDMGELAEPHERVAQFAEHVGLAMGLLSYFGELTTFSPPKVCPEMEKKLCYEERYE